MDNFGRVGRELVASGLGCVIADGSLNCLEVAKVKLQLQDVKRPLYSPASLGQCFKVTLADDGLYRGLLEPGLGATVLRSMTYASFRVGMYSTIRDNVTILNSGGVAPPSLADRMLAGALSGSFATALFAPVDVVRLRMQGDAGAVCPKTGLLLTGLRKGLPPRHTSTLAAFGELYRKEGIRRGLYGGASAAMLRAAVLSSAQLASYETLKRTACEVFSLSEEPTVLHLSCALLSGLIAQTFVQPVDTARTYFMAGGGTWKSLFQKVKAEGMYSWGYRGFAAACLRQGPIMVIQLPLIEKFRLLLGVGYL